jgi:predicted MFS family arabinose efflux permease
VFKTEQTRGGTSRAPFAEAVKRQPRQLVFASGVALTGFSFAYIGASYLSNYGTAVLNLARTEVLAVGILGGVAQSAGILIGAVASDRLGRRRVLARLQLQRLRQRILLGQPDRPTRPAGPGRRR